MPNLKLEPKPAPELYILGIAGTFMAGIAVIAKQLGYRVAGMDAGVYPPMDAQLARHHIRVDKGWHIAHLPEAVKQGRTTVLIGNALSRANPVVEYMLTHRIPYESAPAWLGQEVLQQRTVLVVTGTHGKTTTTAMLVCILAHAGKAPGYLMGGVSGDFADSAALGRGDAFVIEGDEYDTAFFDKRAKFVHYHPNIVTIGNMEFDHADIFARLADIQRQFHYLMRLVPTNGAVIYRDTAAIRAILNAGVWARTVPQNAWRLQGKAFKHEGAIVAKNARPLPIFGAHNARNATFAMLAANEMGVGFDEALAALSTFRGVKRRMEILADGAITLIDDFAHHPTAIAATLTAIRQRYPKRRIIAVADPASHTMRAGTHGARLAAALNHADIAIGYQHAGLAWQFADMGIAAEPTIAALNTRILDTMREGDVIVCLSNGAFPLRFELQAALAN